jgi:transposase
MSVVRSCCDRSGQVEARFANMPSCLVGMEACVGAHHLSRKLKAFGHDARLMPAKYVRPYSKGQKNDFRDADALTIASPSLHTFSEAQVCVLPILKCLEVVC